MGQLLRAAAIRGELETVALGPAAELTARVTAVRFDVGLVENIRGAQSAGTAAKGVSSFGRALGGLGILGVGLELYEGVKDLRRGHVQKGTRDIAAGAARLGSGALALAGVACTPAVLAAAGLGALAYGNQYTKQHAWWGSNTKQEPRSAFDWVGDTTIAAYRGTKQTMGGGLTAGATALGTTAVAVGGDVLGGVIGAAQGIGDFASHLLH